jgi:hypothetical protein
MPRPGVDSEAVTYCRHQAEPINEFGEGVAFFPANTVGDDVSFAGKLAGVGLPRVIPQRLFGYTWCVLNDVEESDCHNQLLDLVLSNCYGTIPMLSVVFNGAGNPTSEAPSFLALTLPTLTCKAPRFLTL